MTLPVEKKTQTVARKKNFSCRGERWSCIAAFCANYFKTIRKLHALRALCRQKVQDQR